MAAEDFFSPPPDLVLYSREAITPITSLQTDSASYATNEFIYNSYSGADITAQILVPNEERPLTIGELQTISYSMHRENTPVRTLGHVNPNGFVRGPRTIAGSLIFTQFSSYTFYKLEQWKLLSRQGFFPVSDMLPPFDIILSFANETGSFSKMKIYGVTIVDEGGTMSVDDLVTEQTYTYMARGIQPLTSYIPEGAVNDPVYVNRISGNNNSINFG